MRLEYTLTEDDYINLNFSYAESSASMKKSMRRARITGPVMFLILPFVMKNVSSISFIYWMGIFSIAAAGWFFLLPGIIKKNTVKQIKKMLAEKDKGFLGQKVLELRPEGIMTKGTDEETMTSYNTVEDITEYKGGVYIYTSSISAIMISPGAFASDKDRKDFLDELKSKTNIKPKPAKKSIYDKIDSM